MPWLSVIISFGSLGPPLDISPQIFTNTAEDVVAFPTVTVPLMAGSEPMVTEPATTLALMYEIVPISVAFVFPTTDDPFSRGSADAL